ncbi:MULTISPECIES: DUF5132 domain-containing protein [unclassified Streptomyces]|uniref:DUF5132 domain-containing protein n=1 Tax=unclassified Streptomyces TaxID=2593676 RepID=UPI00332F37A3
MLPVVPPFLIGLVTASLVKRVGKPLVRGIVKASVGLGLEVQKAVHEAGEGIQDIAAEASAEMRAVHAPRGAGHDAGTPEDGTTGREQTGGRSKPAGKARSTASVATKTR